MGDVISGVTRIMDTQNKVLYGKDAKNKGYDPIALAAKTEQIVVDGNRRKYVQLVAPRFYGGLPQRSRL